MITDSIRSLIESAPDGFFVHDVEGWILDVNERSCIDLGRPRDELLRMTINDISCGSTPAENAMHWANAEPGMAMTLRQIAVRKDGSTFPVEISLTCQIIEGRKLFLGLARDISERESHRAAIEKLNSELELRIEQRTRELREAHEKIEAVMDSAHDAIILQDGEGRYQLLNRSAEKLVGISQANALGKTATEIFGADTGQRLRQEEEKALASGTPSVSEEILPIAGETRTFLTTRSVHRNRQGKVTGLITVARDVTDLKANERRIREEHDRLLVAAQVGGLGIWDYDLLRDVMHCDDRWYRIMGRDPAQPIRSLAEFRTFIHPEDADRATEVKENVALLTARNRDYSIAFRIIRPDGEVRWIRSAAYITQDLNATPNRAIGFAVDITETRLAEEQLRHSNLSLRVEREALVRLGEELGKQALEDSLTAVANRRRLDQELEKACSHAARNGYPLALAMIDVDFFKMYNDQYGHNQGDAALQAVARILASVARSPHDLVARYGGEEFVLLLPNNNQPEIAYRRIAAELATLKLPHVGSPISPYLTVSCGCVVATDLAGIRPADLLARSDQALYRAKAKGRNRLDVVRM